MTWNNEIYKHSTSIPKNVNIHKLSDIDKESNTCHRTIKIEPVTVKSSACINVNVETMIKILNLKLVFM